MDMSPFANSQQQQPTPDYLRQTQGGGAGGAVSNMVKAIMDGNNKFRQRGGMSGSVGQPALNPTTTTGGPSVGAPLSLTPPTSGPELVNGGPGPMVNAGPMAPAPAPPSAAAPPTPPAALAGGMSSPFQDGAAAIPFGSAPGIMPDNNFGRSGGFPGMPNGPVPDRSRH